MPKMEWFTVTTVFVNDKKQRIVHCYGTYPNRKAAINAKNRMKRQILKDYEYEILNGSRDIEQLTYHVCQIFEDN